MSWKDGNVHFSQFTLQLHIVYLSGQHVFSVPYFRILVQKDFIYLCKHSWSTISFMIQHHWLTHVLVTFTANYPFLVLTQQQAFWGRHICFLIFDYSSLKWQTSTSWQFCFPSLLLHHVPVLSALTAASTCYSIFTLNTVTGYSIREFAWF